MIKLSIKKISSIVVIICCVIIISSSQQVKEVYTIQQAQQCFHNQALLTCQNKINQCLTKKQCERELHFYHDCNFEKEYTDQVFNGNCFKNWKNTAIASQQVIGCLDKQCNLAGYNSEVSLQILYTCASQSLINYPTECDKTCQQVLENQISSKIPYKPINQIYVQNDQLKNEIKNPSVEKIIQIIQKQCIDQNGSIRKRHEQNILTKKTRKQKMIDRINEKNKDQEYLKQYNVNDTNRPNTEDL